MYNFFQRWIEKELLGVLEERGIGSIVVSPLAQGLLTNRYLDGIPADSRAGKEGTYLQRADVNEDRLAKIRALNEVAERRGQSLAQMSVAWVLRHPGVTSALIGASRLSQIEELVEALTNLSFDDDELRAIDEILG